MSKLDNSENRRLKILISGRVQAVFFRVSAREVAVAAGLVGFAKNLSDGRVEIVAEGSEAGLRKLLDWSYRGSLLARVDGLSFSWESPTGEFEDFSVEREGSFVEDKKKALKNLGKRVLKRFSGTPPKHLVIVPDGNRRWAKDQGLDFWKGHEQGIKQTSELIKEIKELGIRYVTFWGFSTENWKRPQVEVKWLMKALEESLDQFREDAIKHEIRFCHFGRKDRLPKSLVNKLSKLEEDTKHFTEHHLAIALDYGGRDEIMRAIEAIKAGDGEVSEEAVNKALDTSGFPDVDLIIRTSGEQRTSGILPWQSTYAEFYFSPIHFPDFGPAELRLAVEDYSNRHRRFGGS